MLLTRAIAERALEQACESNPGPWADHARYVALAVKTRFEKRMGCSIYEVLPGVIENSFR